MGITTAACKQTPKTASEQKKKGRIKMQKNIAIYDSEHKYAEQAVYFWDRENTWEQVQNGECQVIEVVLHTGYRPSGKLMTVGETMFIPLGEYDNPNNKNKIYYDWAADLLTRESEKLTTEIYVNTSGNPAVIRNRKGAFE